MRLVASIVLAGIILKLLDVTYRALLMSDQPWGIALLLAATVIACVLAMQEKSPGRI
jgi:FtsH-binding integral membrane protein